MAVVFSPGPGTLSSELFLNRLGPGLKTTAIIWTPPLTTVPDEAPVLRDYFISAVKTNRRSPEDREEFGDGGSLCCAFSRDSCFGRCWVVVGGVTPHHIYGNDPRRQVVWRPHSLSAFDQVKHSYYSETLLYISHSLSSEDQ